jgi:molybdopterin/thiamine biosynthesis adenylyltransferase
MNWWLLHPIRAQSEKAAIGELALSVGWLNDVRWKFAGDLRLSVSFSIHYADTSVQLVMEYPALFPDLPPQVKPAQKQVLSGHQYGSGGELCLEWRTDNWHPEITGAMMIESAHRLLAGEAPIRGDRQIVPNAHQTSLGQDVRASSVRFVLPHETKVALHAAAPGTIFPLRIAELKRADRWVAQIELLGTETTAVASAMFPPEWRRCTGSFFRLQDGATIPRALAELVALIRAAGDETLACTIDTGCGEYPVLLSNGNKVELHVAATWSDDRKLLAYTTVLAPPQQQRLPDRDASIAAAKIGVVGCGSIGSKVAISLARVGAATFILVDGDIFFEANLVRNALDRRAIGLHKTDAVQAAIAEVNPQAEVINYRVSLGAQESSTFMEAAITALNGCDVLIDATGDPAGFNILGGIAQRAEKPLLFAEVYGGGIGGLVCRLRPHKEPIPLAARDQIEAWCKSKGVPAPKSQTSGYAANDQNGAPLIADDTAVSVIAAHLTAMTIDTIATADESRFPFPAYMVGLDHGWIFSVPFETFPIELQPQGAWGPPSDANGAGGVKSFFEDVVADMLASAGETDEA